MEVESENGSDTKYYTGSRAVVEALCTPTRILKLHGGSVTSDSKSSLLASNSSKSRTCSFVAKRYRQIWWNFLALRERELINTNLENLGKRKKLMIKERKIEASQRTFSLSKIA